MMREEKEEEKRDDGVLKLQAMTYLGTSSSFARLAGNAVLSVQSTRRRDKAEEKKKSNNDLKTT